ncbi:MAG TPA: hypothetical protein VEA80_05050 [Vitreimonas sp.]|uniref:hypothetical protein n=1 Tax=Vitreimonas sp. TaxID=3069702 RepID=UPI002D3B5CB9|nr:hypothetical protein [Vitreimonas sp.]HYD86820.1 hypothetical protein [Vitreimonas sp.]
MAQQQFAGVAVLVALAFMVLALSSCANSEQVAAHYSPATIAPIPTEEHAVPEFHDADIGDDALRSRLNGY